MEIGGVRLINIGIEIEKDFPIDTIHVAINLEGRKDTKEECTSEYNRLLEAIKDSLEDAGIPRDEIKNGSYRVSTHTERLYVKDEDGDYYVAASELRGYEYSASMTLERPYSDDEAKRIWIALVECGDDVEFYIRFNLADEDAARSTLLAEAVAEGHKRADVLAAAAGASLAGKHTITYEYGRGGGYRYDALCAPSGPSSNPGFSTPDFNPADETIKCRVDMQWRLELAE